MTCHKKVLYIEGDTQFVVVKWKPDFTVVDRLHWEGSFITALEPMAK